MRRGYRGGGRDVPSSSLHSALTVPRKHHSRLGALLIRRPPECHAGRLGHTRHASQTAEPVALTRTRTTETSLVCSCTHESDRLAQYAGDGVPVLPLERDPDHRAIITPR